MHAKIDTQTGEIIVTISADEASRLMTAEWGRVGSALLLALEEAERNAR